jgi:collagenase-like PrtC family protease
MSARLTLGPLLFNWSPERRRDFYFAIADESEYDTVHLGEVVCVKRQLGAEHYIEDVIERLNRAGKQVVLSSLALITSREERLETNQLASFAEDYLIEANDLSVAARLQGSAFMVGPLVNVYNEGTLSTLVGMGAERVCLAAELPAGTIAHLTRSNLAQIEVQAFGRLPLAISARCYHARSHELRKDGCRFVCDRDPDGMTVETLDGKKFLAVNGTQTMSYRYQRLLGETLDLMEAGVHSFRLWPHSCDMVAVGRIYRDLLDRKLEAEQAAVDLGRLLPQAAFANGYLHGCEGAALIESALA